MPAAAAIDERVACGERFFAAEHEGLARFCHGMAERFARGGRLVAFGSSPADLSDVRHVAVEFVHPVIVGKRALPALGVPCADAARTAGALTIAFAAVGAEHELRVPTEDPFIAQEQVETAYHVLWELVHVFFEHRGLLAGRDEGPRHDTGASSFLYPFLSESEHDLDAVLADVAGSVLAKAGEAAALRAATLGEGREVLEAAARSLRACVDGGGHVLALGNGGSENVLAALAQARRDGLVTIAFVGYDGGRILSEELADHVVVTRSEHIPRIQEAQASAWHVLRGLMELSLIHI